MNELEQALSPVAAAFDELSIPYRVGGSVASSALGVARTTLDIDLCADVQIEHAAALEERLTDAYYVDAAMIREAVQRRDSFNLIHLATMLKIDVFVKKQRRFDREAFERFVLEPLGADPARRFPISTAEDVVLFKLDWYRLGNTTSQKQWDDVLGVLRLQGDALDRGYLDRWARELGVADLLERALAEAAR
jgi:hypothetical protein